MSIQNNAKPKHDVSRAGEAAAPPEQIATDLGDAMHLVTEQFTGLLQSIVSVQPQETVLLRELTRALTLTRATEGFQPVVLNAIRTYREIHLEVLRFRYKKGIPAKLRADILAGFERLLAIAREDLALLSVSVSEVPAGTPLDLNQHQVVRRFETAREERLQTIARCVMPRFSWQTPYGKPRFEPAEVWAFTELIKRQPYGAEPSRNGKPKAISS